MPALSKLHPIAAERVTGAIDWHVWWVEQGSCTVGTKRSSVELVGGDLVVFAGTVPCRPAPGQPTPRIHKAMLPFTWVESWKMPERFFETVMRGAPVRCPATLAEIAPLAGRLRHDPVSLRPTQQRAFAYELRALLWHMADWFDRQNGRSPIHARSPRTSALATRLMQELASDLARPLSLRALAGEAGVSAGQASAVFRKTYGVTIREFLARQRIQKAQELLAETDLKVVDVALACGFHTPSRFYEAFERYCGLPPTSFRSAAKWPRTADHAQASQTPPILTEHTGAARTVAFSASQVVLWVDDVPDNNIDERFLLLAHGIACETRTNNASALAALATYSFAAVITDLTRGKGAETGWYLVAAVRRAHPGLPLFVYTDRVTPRLATRARREGVDAFCCESRLLIDAVTRAIDGQTVGAKAGD